MCLVKIGGQKHFFFNLMFKHGVSELQIDFGTLQTEDSDV